MTLIFYTTTDPPNKINKTLVTVATVTNVMLKDNVSILSPVFIMNYNAALLSANFVYCETFGRYYFIEDITAISGGRLSIACKVDTLYTYRVSIGNVPAIATRSETAGHTEITDNKLPIAKNKEVKLYEFTGGDFNIDTAANTDYNFVLNIMGGGANN